MRTYYNVFDYKSRWRTNSSIGNKYFDCGIKYREEEVTEDIASIIDDFKSKHYIEKRHTEWEYGDDNDESGTGSREDTYTYCEIDEAEFKFMLCEKKVIGIADKRGHIAWFDDTYPPFDYWPCLPDSVWIRRKNEK